MDKETLSNYGWIVICVLVLAVMIALAGPFGNFIADAVKSTTQGLFDVNQNALDAADISIDNQEFDVPNGNGGADTDTDTDDDNSGAEQATTHVFSLQDTDGMYMYEDWFEYEEGMTWGEFINSSYNKTNSSGNKMFGLDSDGYVIYLPNTIYNVPGDNRTDYLTANDKIEYPAAFMFHWTEMRVFASLSTDTCELISSHRGDHLIIYGDKTYCPRCGEIIE